MHPRIDALIHDFLEYLEIERGRSVKTIQNYEHYLHRFVTFSGVREPGDITERNVRDFRLWLNRQKKAGNDVAHDTPTLKKKTQNYYLIALRAFLKYLRKQHITSLAPETIELAKVGDRSITLMTSEELKRLLSAPCGNTLKSIRDMAILQLLFSTGLRVSELCALNTDIDISRDEFAVRGKGDRVRVVFVSTEAKKAVQLWQTSRKDMEEALFVTIGSHHAKNGTKRLTPRSIQRIIKYYGIKAGVTSAISPHTLRHSFATDLLQNGADLRSVQALLGHASITTTQVYTHVTDAHLHEVHRKFHGKK